MAVQYVAHDSWHASSSRLCLFDSGGPVFLYLPAHAIKSGFISIYTKKVADGATAEEAVTDYAPFFFGGMGACYGAFVKTAENLLLTGHDAILYWSVAVVGGLSMIIVPVVLYLVAHRYRHGESGLKSYVDVIERRESRREDS